MHSFASTPLAPASIARRPIATSFRRTGEAVADACARLGISADAVSLASLGAAALAALCLVNAARIPALLALAAALCVLRLWLNMLDGMVAFASGTASRRGEIMNELPDRLSDLAVFGAVAFSGLATPWLGGAAAAGALLVAYMGTLGHAIAGRREFGGLMAKPGRMAAIAAGCLATLALEGSDLLPAGIAPLDPWCALIVVGCAQTCVARLRSTLRLLDEQAVAPRALGQSR